MQVKEKCTVLVSIILSRPRGSSLEPGLLSLSSSTTSTDRLKLAFADVQAFKLHFSEYKTAKMSENISLIILTNQPLNIHPSRQQSLDWNEDSC